MKKIVLVEDEQFVREGTQELLKLNGYEVYSASDGIEGLKVAKAIIPDLIISDIMMPKMNGYDLKEELNKESITSAIPFIFLTAKAEMLDLRLGMELGADDYIVKPFEAITLLKAIKARFLRIEQFKSINNIPEYSNPEEFSGRKYTENDRIFLEINNSPRFIKVADIVCISSMGNYSRIHVNSTELILHRKSMNEWEEMLPEKVFLRIHRATIINLNYVDRISKWSSGSYQVYIKSISKPFTISQRYAARIKNKDNFLSLRP
jgi:DNA-binding LytR/AlgR family response regulator